MKFFCFILLPLLYACSPSQPVAIRGLELSTHESQGKTRLELDSIVSLGNLKLPHTRVAIKDQNRQNMGEVTVEHLEDGTSHIVVSVDLDRIPKTDQSLGKTLPNGREISDILMNEQRLVGIPILENSRVYFGGHGEGIIYAGIALNAPAFDHVLASLKSPLTFFLDSLFSAEVTGTAGIYSGPHQGQNGLAVFAKKSQPSSDQRTPASIRSSLDSKNVDRITAFRLHDLFKRNAILRIK